MIKIYSQPQSPKWGGAHTSMVFSEGHPPVGVTVGDLVGAVGAFVGGVGAFVGANVLVPQSRICKSDPCRYSPWYGKPTGTFNSSTFLDVWE